MIQRMQLGFRTFFKDKLAAAGLIVIALAFIAAVFAPWLAPYAPNSVPEGSTRLLPPGTEGHILGTDQQGRDILSRIIFGTRTSLITALIPVLVAMVASLVIGIVAGYFQGWLGNAIMRIMDVFFAFPAVLLAIAIAAILGPGLLNVIIAMIIVRIPYMTRVVYTDTVQESQKEYVEAAKAFGASKLEIMVKQIFPNVFPALVVYGTTLAGVTIVTVAGLSFIGIGVQPPAADWGRMASEGSKFLMQGHPFVTFMPGLAIVLLSLSFSVVGDGLRNAFDPYERSKCKRVKVKAVEPVKSAKEGIGASNSL